MPVADGYLGQPQLTASKFVADPFRRSKAAASSKRVSDDLDGKAPSKPKPLKRNALSGRLVLMPAATYPDDDCGEHDEGAEEDNSTVVGSVDVAPYGTQLHAGLSLTVFVAAFLM